ncbi:agglutinin-2-like [Alnus glutinosa]|uniref:agglutinin-2-like n=1 Tax=Alnus glutinosa TaxID=3517 RepID=UPI002D76A11C|nr:agglutinin-2-like [Alnus glutinosa]
MAFCIFKIKHLPFPKPLILFYLLLMFTDFFSPLRPFTSVLSFNFPSFNSCNADSPLRCEGTLAQVYDPAIQLTNNFQGQVGRATYFSPIHLWDKASRNLTDFTTNFSFVIDSNKSTNYGDGHAFFLAPTGSTIPDDSTSGTMALTKHSEAKVNSTNNTFVAVEFDIYSNTWDPSGVHVGIDINSMISVANVSWLGANISIMEKRKNEAPISYNSSSHNLSVLFTGLRNNTIVWQSLSYNIDLRDHLPEWVTL